MQIEMIDKGQEKITFMLKGVTTAFANALRRASMDEVPTMAIEDVEFEKNNSIMYDEMVAHRLGLVPLKTDLQSYNLPSKCTCKEAGCAKCQLKMTLKAKSPGIVTTKDIKTKDPKVVPTSKDIPITKLMKGQELELNATAILGKGKEHTKWTPGMTSYSYKTDIKINKEPKNAEEVVKACPFGIFELKNSKLTVNKDKADKCNSCEACVDISGGAIEIEYDDTQFKFTLESWGQLTPKDIMKKAAEELIDKTEEFQEKLKETK